MTNPVAVLRRCKDGNVEYDQLWFVCPGCKSQHDDATGMHALPVNGTQQGATKRPFWKFNGNLESPTLEPSILSQTETATPPVTPKNIEQWKAAPWPQTKEKFVCHSFLRAGVFQFLGDCTHKFKGQNVPMEPLPDWFLEERRA